MIAIMLMHTPAHSSSGVMDISTPCEIEWQHYGIVRPLPAEQIGRQKSWAESGNADAQYFMGLAAQDEKERLAWLKKAIANGSKGAAAYYAYVLDERWKTEPVNPTEPDGERKPLSLELLAELMKPVIEAAEAGDPQAASWLMDIGRRRRGHEAEGTILKRTDRPKWAAIAARGGNPAAAELLCNAHHRSYRGLEGLEKDDAQAFYWCSIAAPRSCAGSAKTVLAELYRNGRGTPPSKAMAEYWKSRDDKAFKHILIERPLPYTSVPAK